MAASALYAVPNWTAIPTVATNCPVAAEWTDYTDFVPDFDPAPDGYVYLKLYYASAVPWDYYSSGSAGGYTYVFRVLPNLSVNSYNGQWQQALRFTAFPQQGDKVALCKRGGSFIGSNFAAMQDVGGGWDWSWFSYWATNAAGEPAIMGTPVNGRAPAGRPGNRHPYSAVHIAGFAAFASNANYYGISTSSDQTNDSNANIELRRAVRNAAWGPANTIVRKTTDGKYKAWSRGMQYNGNIYIWKGPSSDTTLDGVWVVTGVVGTADINAASQSVANAHLLIPVSTMGGGASAWDSSDACGIVAFAPHENYLGKDLLVVSANVDGGSILAFDLANPGGGPVMLWGVQNLMPPDADAARLQLGKAGRFLFVVKGNTASERVLFRLDMLGLSAPDPEIVITNDSQVVPSAVANMMIAGTNDGEVAAMWYTNEASGASGAVAPGAGWSVNVALAQGVNRISVAGTNSIGIAALDTVVITRQDPGQGPPEITIGNGGAQVVQPATSYGLSGSANDNVFGMMWWSNTTAGTGGSMPTAASWSATITGLALGPNQIIVYATNLFNVTTTAATTLDLGFNYYVNFMAGEIGLPEGAGNRGRQASLGTDGSNVYFSRCVAGAPIYQFPWDGSSSADWAPGAAFPALNADNETGDGFGYHNGYLYTFAQLYSAWRSVVRYNIAGDAWENGLNIDNGANTSCVLDDQGYIYGGWRGWDQVEKQSNAFPNVSEVWQAGLGGGANHAWDSTRSASTIYFMKGWGAGVPGRIFSMPADGSAGGTFTLVTETPWPIGTGCAIEYVPAAESQYARPELWVLRGAGGAGMSPDGNGGAETADLAVYDLDHAIWTRVTLDWAYGDGSDLAHAGMWMYLLASGPDDEMSFARTATIPEAGWLGVVLAAGAWIRTRVSSGQARKCAGLDNGRGI